MNKRHTTTTTKSIQTIKKFLYKWMKKMKKNIKTKGMRVYSFFLFSFSITIFWFINRTLHICVQMQYHIQPHRATPKHRLNYSIPPNAIQALIIIFFSSMFVIVIVVFCSLTLIHSTQKMHNTHERVTRNER